MIFKKLSKVEIEFFGHTVTMKRAGLDASIECEGLLAEWQQAHKSRDGSVDLKRALSDISRRLLEIIRDHMLLVDGETIEATAEDLSDELNYAMIVRLWELWHMTSMPSETEKNGLPQP